MFESLKKKLTSFFKKSPFEEKKEEKPRKEKKEKTVEKPNKKTKVKKQSTSESKITTPPESDIPLAKQISEKEELKEEAELEEEDIELESKDKKEIKEEEEIKELKDTQVIQETIPLGFFAKLKQKLTSSILKQEDFDELFQELELTLLESNVALEVVDKIRAELSKDLVGISIKKSQIDETILKSLKDSITSVLIEPPDIIKAIKKSLEPYVILFFGINGTGKTTSIAKLAHMLKKQGISCVLAAADTFRAASIEQLETHANKLKVPIVKSKYGADPASVAFDSIAYAKKNKIPCVLIDTAGRMYTKANLMKEMGKIIRISKPNLKLFVGESITGNDAVEQAKTFSDVCGIDGIILSKADIDEKAGTILSVSYVTQKPIYFLGTGQNYEDLQPFTKKTVLKNLGLE